jgi:hypothetical protein
VTSSPAAGRPVVASRTWVEMLMAASLAQPALG